jgi:hypothetical protein
MCSNNTSTGTIYPNPISDKYDVNEYHQGQFETEAAVATLQNLTIMSSPTHSKMVDTPGSTSTPYHTHVDSIPGNRRQWCNRDSSSDDPEALVAKKVKPMTSTTDVLAKQIKEQNSSLLLNIVAP